MVKFQKYCNRPLYQLHPERKDSEPTKKGKEKGSLVITDEARLKKPQITNDVVNDYRIKHPD
jgi:hypothetical protein